MPFSHARRSGRVRTQSGGWVTQWVNPVERAPSVANPGSGLAP